MFQTDQSTAASTLPAPSAAGTQGYFTNGNPVSGVPATILDADFMNMLMMELVNVVQGAGIALSKTTYNQVLAAIKRIGQNTVVLTDTGAANAYAATNSTPLFAGTSPTWVDGVLQAVKITHANTGASTYAPDGLPAIPIFGLGLQALQGGELVVGGTAILMHATIAGVNSGNPICVLMECAGGAQQVAPATASSHAPQMAQVAGVVGSVRNLVMGIGSASASASMTADEIVVETALGGVRYCLASFSQSINLATTGAGGMDTGAAPASGYVALYAIYNPTTKTAALLATNATSSVAGNVYGGANMPSGYTASALVSVWPTNSNKFFVPGYQNDRQVSLTPTSVLSTSTTSATPTAFSVANTVPPNAKTASGSQTASSTTTASLSMNISGPTQIGQQGQSGNAISLGGPFTKVPLVSQQTLYYVSVCSAGTPTFTATISGYEF